MAKRGPLLIRSYGVTTLFRDKRFTTIEHCGNMGSSMDDVRHNVEKMLGQGAFDRLQHQGEESGSPDYLYSLKIPNTKLDAKLN
jgi:hypothetical protein